MTTSTRNKLPACRIMDKASFAIAVFGCTLLLAGLGCNRIKSGSLESALAPAAENSETEKRGAGQKVRWDGGGIALGDTQNLAYKPDELVRAVKELVDVNRLGAAQRLIERFPDIALEAIRTYDRFDVDGSAIQLIAAEYDKRWIATSNGWATLVADRANAESEPDRYLSRRNEFAAYLKQMQPDVALKIDLLKHVPREAGGMIKVDAHRMVGLAYFLLENHAQAAQHFLAADAIAQRVCPLESAALKLILGECYRHQKDQRRWVDSWRSAVKMRAELSRVRGVSDPEFWKRAAFMRPARAEWPVDVGRCLHAKLTESGIEWGNDRLAETSIESLVWATIGLQSLIRDEPHNAVLAFKKAEAMVESPATQRAYQWLQARGLIASGQPGPASAILIRLAATEAPIAAQARGLLGTLKLQNGSVGQGKNLLEMALQGASAIPPSRLLDIRADLGLALLMAGNEADGLKMLAQVRDAYRSAERFDDAYQCLWNEAKYFEMTKQPGKREAALAQLKEIEAF